MTVRAVTAHRRTGRTLLAAGAVAGCAVLAVSSPAAASNDWHRVTAKTFNNFCNHNHSRDASGTVHNGKGAVVGEAWAQICWGGSHVGVLAASTDTASDGRGVRVEIRYKVIAHGGWRGFHYRALAVNRHGRNRVVFSAHYSGSRQIKGVVARAQLIDKKGRVVASGSWA